jgi:1-deoxy-D-xylulose 5-phosphate reductoisomerase
MSDLEKAQKIVAKHAPFVGAGGTMPKNIAAAVAKGIALGRKEGLELAAQLIAAKIKEDH